jgi:hydrogenase maturation protease
MKAAALILGLGNQILSDDGIGIALARRLEGKIPGVDVATTAMVSLDLLDRIAGYRRLFIIDALTCLGGHPGTLHLCSSHGINFYEIIELGRQLDKPIPEVSIFGIEIAEEIPFGEQLSDAMAERLEGNLVEIERQIRAYIKT